MGAERYIKLHVKFEYFKTHYNSNPSTHRTAFFNSINVSFIKVLK